ncbi:Versiconal hemiacetal acetate reductase [Teratosphaeria destructans]|uniref:Versiconal hemiacetal acetate reductase n=1 Tax=Teratosphaeria destructans TaxID=418781 RepID=A0A9W7VZX9_9PEZI|nr:Versiconal hemiacetal acetate reductase [Teratosphaeria destructans]
MGFGSPKWQGWVVDEERALPLLKHAYDCGINTWDTADSYSHGVSERIIGKAITKYQIPRASLVIMSKCYFSPDPSGAQPRTSTRSINDGPLVNQVGLSRKHILDAVRASVERLGTYIDVLQIHRLDRDVSAKEIMKALNDVIEMGWVRYIGASSMTCWEFQNLQWTARHFGFHEFISMQSYHNLLYREDEREMIPYCKAAGVGLMPWSPLARGVLSRPWNQRTERESSDKYLDMLVKSRATGTDKAIIERVEEVAAKAGVSMACIATAWSISKGCCPIIGMTSEARIEEAIVNASYVLSDEDCKYLEECYIPKPLESF